MNDLSKISLLYMCNLMRFLFTVYLYGISDVFHIEGFSRLLSSCSYLLPHHFKGSSTERWSRNTPRVVTARVYYVVRESLKVTGKGFPN